MDWIKQGNNYFGYYDDGYYHKRINPQVPDHSQLSAREASWLCHTEFPRGMLSFFGKIRVGDNPDQLLPGIYEYRREGDKRVPSNCELALNHREDNEQTVEMPYGEPFTFRFYQYHGHVYFASTCDGALYRIGD